jgi:hypothetical protein
MPSCILQDILIVLSFGGVQAWCSVWIRRVSKGSNPFTSALRILTFFIFEIEKGRRKAALLFHPNPMTTREMFAKLIGANYLLSKPHETSKDKDPLRYSVRSWLYYNKDRVLRIFTMLYEDEADMSEIGGLMKELIQARKEIEMLTARNLMLRRNNNIVNSKMVQDFKDKIASLEFRIEVLQQFREVDFASPAPEDVARAMEDLEKARKIKENEK